MNGDQGRKLLACLPFFIVVGLVSNTWCKFYRHEYEPSLVHYVTLTLVGINGVLLVIRFKPGVLLTGVILLFAAFGLLYFFKLWYVGCVASGSQTQEANRINCSDVLSNDVYPLKPITRPVHRP